MRVLVTCVFVVAVAACGGKKENGGGGGGSGGGGTVTTTDNGGDSKPTKKHGPKGEPHPQKSLTVTVDGKPVEMATALAFKVPDGGTQVTVSSQPVSCDQVNGSMREIYDNEITFDVNEAQQMQPDGSVKPAIVSTYFDGSTHQQTMATSGSGDGSDGKVTTLDVDFNTTGVKGAKLVVKGTIDAVGCAPKQGDDPLQLPAEMPASITIAGKKLAVHNAMISKVGDWPTLEITTGGETCDHKMGEQAGSFKIRMTWFKADKPEVSQIDLGGALLPQASDQTFDKKKITVDPAPPDKIEQVKIHADVVVDKYPVQIDGTVMPVVCKH
jgi:hypothetical protein|nr:hypothetical protein [Kofleriaceae bacterium]